MAGADLHPSGEKQRRHQRPQPARQSQAICYVPASVKTEDALGDWQVLPETAVCLTKQGWLIDTVTPRRFWSSDHKAAGPLGGGGLISDELGAFPAPPPAGRSRWAAPPREPWAVPAGGAEPPSHPVSAATPARLEVSNLTYDREV